MPRNLLKGKSAGRVFEGENGSFAASLFQDGKPTTTSRSDWQRSEADEARLDAASSRGGTFDDHLPRRSRKGSARHLSPRAEDRKVLNGIYWRQEWPADPRNEDRCGPAEHAFVAGCDRR
jgi:hypothetical protein